MDGNKEETREAREKKAGRNGLDGGDQIGLAFCNKIGKESAEEVETAYECEVDVLEESRERAKQRYFLLCPPLPTWLKTTPEEIVDQIIKLARKGLTPHKSVSPSVTRMVSPRKDKDSKFRLILVESRIHRLARSLQVQATDCPYFQIRLGHCFYFDCLSVYLEGVGANKERRGEERRGR
ncbi:hypothetical protein K435DRAFT_796201 [Dendrothele bispora CBS 962.96]|uniref:Small ribosomal subunit protein uS15 N-terminal domain-containing protein n=1 Tax=Dendrothele bispora (strain CBS 962.96) TaxID=1314807 RepID=A0A4S8M6B2_DENBC|nr:hypothetical protein K435DRAFT_796201 [Dendrothele bispora CBS 962.96]